MFFVFHLSRETTIVRLFYFFILSLAQRFFVSL